MVQKLVSFFREVLDDEKTVVEKSPVLSSEPEGPVVHKRVFRPGYGRIGHAEDPDLKVQKIHSVFDHLLF